MSYLKTIVILGITLLASCRNYSEDQQINEIEIEHPDIYIGMSLSEAREIFEANGAKQNFGAYRMPTITSGDDPSDLP